MGNLEKETKEMIDFILKKGYKIKVEDFRDNSVGMVAGFHVIPSVKIAYLKKELADITIYKSDPPEATKKEIEHKYNALKELISIQDGSIFDKENLSICNYVTDKLKTL